MEKKKGSDHFRDILNPYGEKSNYGKIGRRRRLSKLNVCFFSIILLVTIQYIYIYVCKLLYIQILNVDFVFITFSQMLLGKSKTRFPAVTLMVSPASWSSV